mmetsp:Transcript_1955/g.4671  ORF Transcript_1955/g.4671 Transcript_1955/m.4671 type:complete len:80 (+) Transcript_1955:324-563(+)
MGHRTTSHTSPHISTFTPEHRVFNISNICVTDADQQMATGTLGEHIFSLYHIIASSAKPLEMHLNSQQNLVGSFASSFA